MTWTTHAQDLTGDLVGLRESIERAVPLSAGRHNATVLDSARPRVQQLRAEAAAAGFDPATYAKGWALQWGSLGSGNHFIEVTADETDAVWLFLHSGSRGIGNKIAMHHIGVAQALMDKWWITLPDRDLAYLVEGTVEFDAYLAELLWAQRFALLNRAEMMDRVVDCLAAWTGVVIQERSESTATTTSHSRSGTSVSRCGCRGRARSRRAKGGRG